jgi:DNA-binding phage protein
MERLRTWREFLIEKLADPEEALGYLQVSLEEYLVDGDTSFFLKGLRNVVEAQGGISEIAKQARIAPQVLSKILSSEDLPSLHTLGAIFRVFGGQLSIKPLQTERHAFASRRVELIKSNEPVAKDTQRVTEP